jgi:predicted Zn-dependent peptidase
LHLHYKFALFYSYTMKTQLKTLDNGLRVILTDTNAFPTITTLLLIGAGSRYENEKNNGIAHFFEHMAFKGSQKYPSSFVISSVIEGLGGYFNAFTAKDHTGYWVKATADHFESVIDVLSDMILHPLLVEDEINREKGVIIEEINMYEDMPARKVSDLFEEILYKNTPLGFDIAGTRETVNSFDRETFTEYIGNFYHPENAVVVVAGGLTHSSHTKTHDYLKIIEDKFKDWQPKKRIPYIPVVESQTKPSVHVKHKKTEQAHFCFGFRAFSTKDPRRHALALLGSILGGGMSSRLFIEVRERRGLCYYVSTGRELYGDVGNLVTQAGVTNSLEKVQEAITVVWNEHQKMAQGDVKEEEIIKAKEMLKGRLMLSLEDSFSVAAFQGTRQILEGSIVTPAEVIEKIDAVTAEDITKVAKELFTKENLSIALVGPFEQKDLDLDFLK